MRVDGGVCYFLWDKDYDGLVSYSYKSKGNRPIVTNRNLKSNNSDIIIRDCRRIGLVEKISRFESFSNIVSARKPFEIGTDLFNNTSNYTSLLLQSSQYPGSAKIFGVKGYKGGAKRIEGYIKRSAITKNVHWIDKYKLFISKAYSTDAITPPELIVADHNTLCTETFLVIGPFDTKEAQLSCLKYTYTNFYKILLFFGRGTMQVSQEVFRFVPLQDFTGKSDIDWSKSVAEIDKQLYAKYHLTEEEISFIESMIKPM